MKKNYRMPPYYTTKRTGVAATTAAHDYADFVFTIAAIPFMFGIGWCIGGILLLIIGGAL